MTIYRDRETGERTDGLRMYQRFTVGVWSLDHEDEGTHHVTTEDGEYRVFEPVDGSEGELLD